jgi:hypothetical protein
MRARQQNMHFNLLLLMMATHLFPLLVFSHPSKPSVHDRATLSVRCTPPFVPTVARSNVSYIDMICCPTNFATGGWWEGNPICCPTGTDKFNCNTNWDIQRRLPGKIEKCYINGKEGNNKVIHKIDVCETDAVD